LPAEVLTPAEVAAIIGQCSASSRTGIRNPALLTLLYRSGLRVSEALALKPSDINLAPHSVRVLNGKGGKATTRGIRSPLAGRSGSGSCSPICPPSGWLSASWAATASSSPACSPAWMRHERGGAARGPHCSRQLGSA
jgi:hypothetical protein